VVEFTGYVVFALTVFLGLASPLYVIAFFMVAFVFGTALSIAAVGLEELTFRRYPRFSDLTRLFGLAMLEHFGFRQLLTYWRVRGVISSWRRGKGWGEMRRRGFAVEGGVNSGS
jgi:arginine exporter protein ArgO